MQTCKLWIKNNNQDLGDEQKSQNTVLSLSGARLLLLVWANIEVKNISSDIHSQSITKHDENEVSSVAKSGVQMTNGLEQDKLVRNLIAINLAIFAFYMIRQTMVHLLKQS